ncbi:hypothetical protein K501DRAFT_278450 [Backusella circina FSU 941]|nr:hypothetical protein K501DRAFT_278450 [Backusella circina FSU 941]
MAEKFLLEMNEEIEITTSELYNRLNNEEKGNKGGRQIKSYDIQSPSTIVLINSPVIKEGDIVKAVIKVENFLGTNTTFATRETLGELRNLPKKKKITGKTKIY